MQTTTFNRYAVLAVLAAVLGFGQRMYAEVVYTPVDIIAGTGILKIDLNNDGVPDVSIVAYASKGSGLCGLHLPVVWHISGSIWALPAAGNGVVVSNLAAALSGSAEPLVAPLSSNATIGSSDSFYSAEALMLSYSTGCLNTVSGAWQNISNQYLRNPLSD